MDEPAAGEEQGPSTEGELVEVDPTPEDDEVEGHSMAISANFAIDIGGVAPPGTVPDKVRPKVGDGGAPTGPVPPVR